MPSVLSRLLLAPDRLFSVPGSPAVPIVEPCSVISHPWCQTCLEANKTVIRTVLYKCFRTYFTLYLVYLLCTFCPISCFLIRPLKMGTTLSSDVFFFKFSFHQVSLKNHRNLPSDISHYIPFNRESNGNEKFPNFFLPVSRKTVFNFFFVCESKCTCNQELECFPCKMFLINLEEISAVIAVTFTCRLTCAQSLNKTIV